MIGRVRYKSNEGVRTASFLPSSAVERLAHQITTYQLAAKKGWFWWKWTSYYILSFLSWFGIGGISECLRSRQSQNDRC